MILLLAFSAVGFNPINAKGTSKRRRALPGLFSIVGVQKVLYSELDLHS